ncbi:hypothetical protein [Teredinibacter turnerae]|uniref:hypothetical protein n=1 Tax=Teredinibacter turnerae TaxID=2426 RepID=UPI00035C913D|nr:hypothetical protein [Teredinibacter turnerae]
MEELLKVKFNFPESNDKCKIVRWLGDSFETHSSKVLYENMRIKGQVDTEWGVANGDLYKLYSTFEFDFLVDKVAGFYETFSEIHFSVVLTPSSSRRSGPGDLSLKIDVIILSEEGRDIDRLHEKMKGSIVEFRVDGCRDFFPRFNLDINSLDKQSLNNSGQLHKCLKKIILEFMCISDALSAKVYTVYELGGPCLIFNAHLAVYSCPQELVNDLDIAASIGKVGDNKVVVLPIYGEADCNWLFHGRRSSASREDLREYLNNISISETLNTIDVLNSDFVKRYECKSGGEMYVINDVNYYTCSFCDEYLRDVLIIR